MSETTEADGVDLRDYMEKMDLDGRYIKFENPDNITIGRDLELTICKVGLGPFVVILSTDLEEFGYICGYYEEFDEIDEAIERFNQLEVRDIFLEIDFQRND